MPALVVTIDRLDLDLRGFPLEVVQSALAGIGEAMETAFRAQVVGPIAPVGPARLGRIDAGSGRLEPGTPAGTLREAISHQVAATVVGQLQPPPFR
jgi:hypothetical protein